MVPVHRRTPPSSFRSLGHGNPAFRLSGFVVGALVGLSASAVAPMTLSLILLFGTPAATAVGTDLLQAAATKSVGSIARWRTHTVDWRIAGHLAAGSLPASVLTIGALHLIGVSGNRFAPADHGDVGHRAASERGRRVGAAIAPAVEQSAERRQTLDSAADGSPGLVLGVLVTISSVGGGSLGMTLLVLLYPGVRLVRLVGTDTAHAAPLTLVAGLGHCLLGSINWALMAALLLGSIPGVVLASYLRWRPAIHEAAEKDGPGIMSTVQYAMRLRGDSSRLSMTKTANTRSVMCGSVILSRPAATRSPPRSRG